jgi:hypothetical protein
MRRAWVLLPVLVLAGCGGGKSTSGPVLQTVQISEKEYSLTPNAVHLSKPGTYEFQVTNDGQITHAFNVEGPGLEEQEAGNIDTGKMKTLRVTFPQTGSFEMYCPIDGHKQQGMKGTITIGAATGGGTTTTQTTMTTTTTATTTTPGTTTHGTTTSPGTTTHGTTTHETTTAPGTTTHGTTTTPPTTTHETTTTPTTATTTETTTTPTTTTTTTP